MKSMRFRLWAGMMALIAIVLILLWLFQIVFLESFYTTMHISGVKKEAAAILDSINAESSTGLKNAPDSLENGSNGLESKLDALAFKNNMSIELIDSDGNVAYSTGTAGMNGQMPMMMNGSRTKVFQQALAGDTVQLTLEHPRFGNQFMMIGLPAKSSGSVEGVLIMNLPLAPVEETAAILKNQLLYITGILLVASLLISFLLSRSFTKPILDIKKAAETMASGDFSVRINTKKQDEIGKLSGTVNYLGEQLSKIDQLRKDLIANVSHELRTPLSLIRGYAETIRDVSGDTREKREKHLEIIIEETERLSRIVDDVLNLSQLQSGYTELSISQFPVKETLEAIVERYQVLSEKTGVGIAVECPADTVINADKAKIEQVFYNLINNAFNHTPAGGSITARASIKSTGANSTAVKSTGLNSAFNSVGVNLTGANSIAVRFEISDTGSGIAEEDLPHIWDRFYKADKTGSRKSAGTGLGLAIAKGILDAHMADYGVESKPGRGTTFWFELRGQA